MVHDYIQGVSDFDHSMLTGRSSSERVAWITSIDNRLYVSVQYHMGNPVPVRVNVKYTPYYTTNKLFQCTYIPRNDFMAFTARDSVDSELFYFELQHVSELTEETLFQHSTANDIGDITIHDVQYMAQYCSELVEFMTRDTSCQSLV